MTADVIIRPRLIVPVLRPRPGGWRGIGEPGGWEWTDGERSVPVVEGGALGTHPYVYGYLNAFTKKISWTTDTSIMVALMTSGFTPAQSQQFWGGSGVSTNEVANGNGYSTGGVALGSPTNVVVSSTQTLSGANVSWTSSGAGFSTSFAVIYDSATGVTATEPLIAWVDFGGSQTVAGGAVFQVNWNASGIVACTVS